MIGRRSGNRGQCAQPCRLPYGYGRFDQNRYPLSLKDNCLIEYLRDLERMGVASLKIEGRMKRPEYVAVVTKAYRAALNGKRVTQADMEELERVFSRQGFTQGLLSRAEGPGDVRHAAGGRGREGTLRGGPGNIRKRRGTAGAGAFYAMLQAGRPAQLAVQDDLGNVCKTVGPEPEPAVYHALTREDLREPPGQDRRDAISLRVGEDGARRRRAAARFGHQRDAARCARTADGAAWAREARAAAPPYNARSRPTTG